MAGLLTIQYNMPDRPLVELLHKSSKIMFYKNFCGAALVTAKGQFIAASEYFCSLVEYSELELQKLQFKDITDPNDILNDTENAQRLVDGKADSYEMRKSYITKNKHILPVVLRVDAIRDEQGNFICFLSQIRTDSLAPLNNGLQQVESFDIKLVKFLTSLRKNWPMILWILTGLAAFVGYVVSHHKK